MKQMKSYFIILIALYSGFLTGCIEDPKIEGEIQNAMKPQMGATVKIERTATSITLTASVEKGNGAAIEERGLCWSTKENPTVDSGQSKAFGKGLGKFSGTIEGLSNNTEYYIRPYAKNRKGIAYGEESKISTNTGLGSVRTFVIADNIRAKTALCGGKIMLNGEGTILARGVYYSTSPSMTPMDSILSTMETDSFLCRISGLKTSTTYYVRAFVKNNFGSFPLSNLPQSFTTTSGLPILSPVTILERGYTTAKLSASVLDEGDAPVVQRGICWGTEQNPTIQNASYDDNCGVGTGVFNVDCKNLASKQKYYVRAFARNEEFGISYSKQDSFTTKSNLPTVITSDLKSISKGGAVIGGKIENPGQSHVISCGICLSTTVPEPTLLNADIVDITPDTEGNFSRRISGLKGGQTYYIRAYATNSEGTSYGDTKKKTMPSLFTTILTVFNGTPRVSNSTAYFSINNLGYILGGDIGPQYTSELHYYNAATDEWKAMLPYPEAPLKWQTAVAHKNSAYVFGGIDAYGNIKKDFYHYNSLNNSWYKISAGTVPPPSYLSAGFALNDSICYVGGRTDTVKNDVWMYEISQNKWFKKPDFPEKQYGGIAVTIGTTAYVGLGKKTNGDFNNILWKTTDLNSWTQESVCTIASGGILAGVVHKNKIYMIDEAYYIIEYDPSTMIWTKKARLPKQNQEVHCMFTLYDLIYIGLSKQAKNLIYYDPSWDN